MGQKLAAYNTQGAITGFYDSVDSPVPSSITNVIAITDQQWQTCLSTPGYVVVNGALIPPAPPSSTQLLSAAQATQIASLYSACSTAITAGFTSAALGAAHSYPSTLMDQSNQVTVSNNAAGGLLWCETGSAWSFVAHTQAQAQQVVADFSKYLNKKQSELITLTAAVNSASTVAAVQAVAWQ